MPIRFVCPQCHQLLGASARKVGRQVQCPKCSADVVVPTEEEAEAAAVLRRFEHPQIEAALNTLVVIDPGPERVDPAGKAIGANKRPAAAAEAPLLIPRKAVYFQAGLLAAVALLFFAAGWWIGGSGGEQSRQAAIAPGPVTLDVLLHYRDPGGELQPDAGAVVLVLPADKRVSEKLPGAPLDPAAPQPNAASPAIGKLNLVGGAYGRTDAAGKLTGLVVPQAGKHHVLLLSNHGRRTGEPRPQDLATLGTFLDGAAELLGDRAYRLTSEELHGELAITHDFGVE